MPDPERLVRLVNELMSDARYATGSRRFPLAIADDEAAAIAEALDEELDRGAAARAELAAAQGLRIHCHEGCAACCEVMVMTFRPEALRIAMWLAAPEHASERAAFLERYRSWRAQVGDAPERIADAFVAGRQKDFDQRHLAHQRRRIPCAFLVDGRCSVYEVRPLGCRNTHALDTDARCVADPPDGRPAQAVSLVPLDKFLKDATRMLRAAHNAQGQDPGTKTKRHRQESICVAVYELLVGQPGDAK